MTTRPEFWMSTPDEEKKIVSALWAAEAMARDREAVMALTSDMKVRPQAYLRRVDIVEVIRCDR